MPVGTAMRRLAERINEPFRRGAFGRGVNLRQMLVTSGSLAGTKVVTSALGFPFWWIAAQLFSAEVVGLAAATISGMLLFGGLSAFGLGTLLIRELPLHPGHEGSLIRAALATSGASGIVVGLLFAYGAPAFDPALAPLSTTFVEAAILATGVSLTAIAIVTDEALVGLLRGEVLFARNVAFALAKLALLAVVGLGLGGGTWAAIYGAWSISVLLSLALVVGVASRTPPVPPARDPRPSVSGFGSSAAGHFFLNLVLTLPTLGMPLIVTMVGSPALNASFYLAWLLASAANMIPLALSSTLYAVGSRSPGALPRQMKLTLVMSSAAAAAAATTLAIAGGPLLSIFGPTYVDAAPALAVIAVAALPMVIKDHFHVLLRIRGQLSTAVIVCAVGASLELGAAAVGLLNGGLPGLAAGWLVAVTIEAAFMAIPIVRTAFAPDR